MAQKKVFVICVTPISGSWMEPFQLHWICLNSCMYIIWPPLVESAVSCIYALLTGKSQEIYEEMFQAILKKVDEHRIHLNVNTTMSFLSWRLFTLLKTSWMLTSILGVVSITWVKIYFKKSKNLDWQVTTLVTVIADIFVAWFMDLLLYH